MNTANQSRPPETILPQHQALITGSAISPEVAAARGYRSVTKKTELPRPGLQRQPMWRARASGSGLGHNG